MRDEIGIGKGGNGNDPAPLDGLPRLDAELEIEQRHTDQYRELERRVPLVRWPHGSDEDWKRIAPHLREFAGAVREGRQQYRNGPAS